MGVQHLDLVEIRDTGKIVEVSVGDLVGYRLSDVLTCRSDLELNIGKGIRDGRLA
jgi:hypothetical protein